VPDITTLANGATRPPEMKHDRPIPAVFLRTPHGIDRCTGPSFPEGPEGQKSRRPESRSFRHFKFYRADPGDGAQCETIGSGIVW
jgi:hypothetical protein